MAKVNGMKKEQMTIGDIEVVIDNVKYTWYGWTHLAMESREFGLKEGDVRVIGDCVMYVYNKERKNLFSKPVISWRFLNQNQALIDNVRNIIFGE